MGKKAKLKEREERERERERERENETEMKRATEGNNPFWLPWLRPEAAAAAAAAAATVALSLACSLGLGEARYVSGHDMATPRTSLLQLAGMPLPLPRYRLHHGQRAPPETRLFIELR